MLLVVLSHDGTASFMQRGFVSWETRRDPSKTEAERHLRPRILELSTAHHPARRPVPSYVCRRTVRPKPSKITSIHILQRVANSETVFLSSFPFVEQTEIMVLSDDSVPPPSSPPTTTPAPVPAPTATTTPAPAFAPVATPAPVLAVPTPEQLYSAKDVEDFGGTVTATAELYDPRTSAENGCDPAGCTADLTRVRDERQ